MKLYINKASPFARKARILAREAGIADRIEEVETIVSPVAANETLARDNPLIKIPALVTDGGETLYDSRVIIGQIGSACVCGYLDFRFGDWNWRSSRPRLAAWFERVSRRPSVAATVPSA